MAGLSIEMIKIKISLLESRGWGYRGTVTYKALKELLEYKETGLTPDEIKEMKKRHEKIDLMATEYDNICEKYDKLYGKEQM